jgi:hypothetical protein
VTEKSEIDSYRLIGGRTDYFEHQRAAVVLYQRGLRVINVFSWAANQRSLPKNTTRNGYHLAFWRAGNLVYCAVSDTAWDELLGLARLLQDLSTRDTDDAKNKGRSGIKSPDQRSGLRSRHFDVIESNHEIASNYLT